MNKKLRTYYFNFLDMKLLNLVLLTVQAVSAADVDCYKLLGVTKKDTNKKIKSAYRFVEDLFGYEIEKFCFWDQK